MLTKDCFNCKHGEKPSSEEPCNTCLLNIGYSKWEEDKNENNDKNPV